MYLCGRRKKFTNHCRVWSWRDLCCLQPRKKNAKEADYLAVLYGFGILYPSYLCYSPPSFIAYSPHLLGIN